MLDQTIAELESAFQEITRLQKENISQAIEMAYTKVTIAEKLALAEIKAKRYSGIKKYFR